MTIRLFWLCAVALFGSAAIALASLELVPTEQGDDGEGGTIRFDQPLTGSSPEVNGKSLQDLLGGSPAFAPIDGLPDALWTGKECSTCHQWSREDLCEHGKRYVAGALEHALAKPHPYGGGFKQSVHDWANAGCR